MSDELTNVNEEINTESTVDGAEDRGLPVEGQQPDTSVQSADGEQTQQQEQTQQKPQQATQADGNASPPWWKQDLFKLKYRGSEVTPRDYNHAVQLMQKGWSYEQAMAQVNAQKQEIESQKQAYEQYAKLDKAFKENPAFAQRIQQMYAESMGMAQANQQQQQQMQQQYAIPPQLSQELSQMRQFIAQEQERRADSEVQQEIQSLKSQFSNEQWDAVTETGHTFLYDVLNHAKENRFPNLMAAYRDYTYDRVANNARMQGVQQAAQQRQQQVRRGVIGAASPKPPASVKPEYNPNMSYDDIVAQAKKQLNLVT